MKTSSFFAALGRPACENGWRTESKVRTIAGALVLVSLGLSLVDRRFLWLTAFVGANLLQSGLTGWCLLSNLISKGASASQTQAEK